MTHGGARPGAGRKPKPIQTVSRERIAETDDPAQFLTAVMNDCEIDIKLRVEAAKVLLRFLRRASVDGKKERQAEAAKKVAPRFATSQPPTNIRPLAPH